MVATVTGTRTRLVWGPPGTGKTRRLLEYINNFMRRYRGRVLFCSHTRAAALEATSRFSDPDLLPRIDIQTLHSVCFRGLKMSRAQTVDESKLESFGQEFGIDMTEEGLGKEFIDVLSLSRSRMVSAGDGYNLSYRPGSQSHYESFCRSYQEWKQSFGYMDFNDMLESGSQKLNERDTYALIAIDEAQDLTPLHWGVVRRLVYLNPRARILVAGDDDQTIYGFTGADPQGMRNFGESMQADTVVLSQSYRITQQVHELAQAIIARVSDRVPKEYAPRLDDTGFPAQGRLELFSHMDHMYSYLSPTRDSLIMYADRFVRSEIEALIQEWGQPYRALNGFPSPQDSRAGRAIQAIYKHTDEEIDADDDLRNLVRSGLTARGAAAWDNISIYEPLTRIRRGDWSLLAVKHEFEDYLKALDYSRPQNVRISTMHGAKGLQADDVHLILSLSPRTQIEAATNPDSLHRLLYTAVTRARENLYLYDGENGYDLPVAYAAGPTLDTRLF